MKRTPLKRKTRLQSGGPLRKRRKTRKGQVPEAVLDGLWSQVVRERDIVCMCAPSMYNLGGCHGRLEAAHVYSRKYKQIRWDLDNGVALCAKHHAQFHDNPVIAGRKYLDWRGREKLDWLWAKAQAVAKIDRHAVKADLQARLKAMEGQCG